MAHAGSRSGAANLAIPLMVAAFLAMIGLLWWLSVTAEGTTGAGTFVSDSTTADAGPVATTIELADLQLRPDSLLGQDIRLAGASVASRLGDQAFWISLPNRNPFLVHLAPSAVGDSVRVEQAQTVTLVGNVFAMTDSVLDTWVADSVITEGQTLEAGFATHFIEARQVDVQGGAASPGAGQDAGGAAG